MSAPLQIVARARTPFKEKFAVPRQPGLTPAITGRVELVAPFDDPHALRGIEGFSHLWLVFGFHLVSQDTWRPLIRPPRLGGNEKIGVFASRSTHRPNGLGLSVVKLIEVDLSGPALVVGGLDLVDGTPIYDIKPYLPMADALPEAAGGYAQSTPEVLPVRWTTEAEAQRQGFEAQWPELKAVIEQIISQDPRPAYRHGEAEDRVYGVRLYDLDVKFQFRPEAVWIVSVEISGDSSAASAPADDQL